MASRDAEEMGSPPARETPDYVRCFSDRLAVSCGALHFDSPHRRTEIIPDGLSVGVMLSGQMEYSLHGRRTVPLAGPCLFLLASRERHSGDHAVPADTCIRFASVQVDAGFVQQEFGLDLDCLASRAGRRACEQPFFFHCPAARSLQSLAAQMLTCPFQGAAGDIYLAGKALELIALATCPLLDCGHSMTCRLSSADIQRLHEAREIMAQELQNPPSLTELASRVGLNVKKLTSGFRELFGTSVFAFLQERRLNQAYQMLATGEISVSEAAYRVGYSIAHFSTAFQKRFGVSPSALRS